MISFADSNWTPPSRWVCSEHFDQPVTWRGKGCRQCRARVRDWKRNRRRNTT